MKATFGLATLCAVSILAACGGADKPQAAREAQGTQKAEPAALSLGREDIWVAGRSGAAATAPVLTGAIQAERRADLRAEVGSVVQRVLRDNGEPVKRGELLVKLDDAAIRDALLSAEEALRAAERSFEGAERTFQRLKSLQAQGMSSVQAMEDAEVRRNLAQSEQVAAKARVSTARQQLERTEVRAPFDGIILTRNAEVGQLGSPGAGPLFRIGRRGSIEMRGNVAERDLPRLKVGQAARVRVTGVDQAFEGEVRLIGAVIEPSTRLGSVRIELREHRDLRPGAFARGEVETGRGSRPVIPQTSVMSDSGGNYVYLVGADNVVERRDVRIDGSRVEGLVVAAGLTGGERLIKTAGPYLRVGEKVRVAK